MKARIPLLAMLASATAAHGAGPQPAVPADFPVSRYDAMIQDAPFAVATAALPVVAAPSFAASLYVTGVARIGDKDLVTISTRDRTKRFALFSGEASEGIEVIKIDWSDNVGGSKVSVKKGSEFATLEFDRAELAKPIAPAPPAPSLSSSVINQPVFSARPTIAPSHQENSGSSIRVRRRSLPIPGPR